MLKIGVFDSGIGGITVLTELKQRFSGADYFYLGDTAHLPYGAKSPSQIKELSIVCARKLKDKKIDALVVACNTASSLAIDAIREVMNPIPVFGVVEPGVEATLAALVSRPPRKKPVPVLVLATRATVRSHAYGDSFQKILNFHSASYSIIEQACPILVPIIEEGWLDHPILHQAIAEYVQPHLNSEEAGVALLACTHYPWIHKAFEKALPGWTVVNSAQAVAQSLAKSDLFSKNSELLKNGIGKTQGSVEWSFTDPEVVPEFAKDLIASQSRLKKGD